MKCDPDALMRTIDESKFELDGWIDTAPFKDLLGRTIEEAVEGRAVPGFPFGVKLARGRGCTAPP